MELIVVQVYSLLVLLQQIKDLIELEQQVEKTLKLCLSLLTDIHLHHLFLLELDCLKDDVFFFCGHEYSMKSK